MKVKTFLTISAVVLGLFGLSMIFNSANMAKGFGLDLNNLGRVLFRDLGTTLVGVAAINWFSRGSQNQQLLKTVLAGNLIMQTLGVLVNVADIMQGYIGSGGWGGVLLHGVLAAGFGYYYFSSRATKALE